MNSTGITVIFMMNLSQLYDCILGRSLVCPHKTTAFHLCLRKLWNKILKVFEGNMSVSKAVNDCFLSSIARVLMKIILSWDLQVATISYVGFLAETVAL